VPAPVKEESEQANALSTPDGLRINTKDCETPFALAVRVTDCDEATGVIVALKFAVVAPAATVTVAGMETLALSLAKAIVKPPVGAACVRVTVQASVATPV